MKNRSVKNQSMKTMYAIIASLWLAGVSTCMAADDVIPTLSVNGQAELKVQPDQVSIDLGVSSIADTASQAMADNNRTMRQVMAALQELGLQPQTRQFRLQELWTPRPQRAETDWRPSINGYKVDNSVVVKSDQLELAGDIIARATAAGANHINNVSYGLANPRVHREAAIVEATRIANSDAQSLATAAGQSIVRIIRLNLDHTDASPVVMRNKNLLRSAAMAEDSSPPLEAADVIVRAGVSVSYEIK
jgi:hypothetical protein